MNYIYFGTKSSADFKVFLTDAGVYATPQREYEKISVPGRNGDVLIEQDRFSNVMHEYPCVITEDFDANFKAFSAFLLSQKGYMRLEDSFHPDEFYIATFKGIDSLKHTTGQKMGTFVLKFDRKPQRYLKRGEQAYSFPVSSGSQWSTQYIKNPTTYNAYPLITVTGSGQLSIENISIAVSVSGSYTTTIVDCENQEAYYQQTSRNSNITLSSGEFPYFLPDKKNTIQYKGFLTIQIVPRWWTI